MSGNDVVGLRTSQDDLGADAVIVAAGLGSAGLCDQGDALQARKGQLIITDRARLTGPAFDGHMMSASYIAAKRGGAPPSVTPVGLVIDPLMTGQFLIGGTREDGWSDTGTDIRTVSATKMTMELGGHAPAIVFGDANWEKRSIVMPGRSAARLPEFSSRRTWSRRSWIGARSGIIRSPVPITSDQ